MSPHPEKGGIAAGSRPRQEGIEAFRLICCLAVIFAHTLPDLPNDNTLMVAFRATCRGVVPFFFMVSGFFLPVKGGAMAIATASFRRIAPVYFGWAAFYMVFWLLVAPGWPTGGEVLRKVLHIFPPALDGGFGLHLWFLPALWIGVAVVAFLRHHPRLLALVAGVCFTLGLMLGGYSEALGIPRSPIWVARSGLLMAVPFVALGYFVARRGISLPLPAAWAILGAGYLLFLAELSLLSAGFTRWQFEDFLIGSLPFGLGMFLVAQRSSGPIVAAIAPWGRMTLWVYCVHLAILYLLIDLLYLPPEAGLGPRFLLTALVSLLSVASAILAERVKPWLRPSGGGGVLPRR